MAYEQIKQRLRAGHVVILDGATGTELQRRGVGMDPTAWCATHGAEAQATLTAIHKDYIEAGADVITANTFASSRMILKRAGFEDRFDDINRRAVDAALEAAQGTAAAVGGSLSHMIPRRDLHGETSPAEIAENYLELAQLLKLAGCEVILLEMMFAPERMAFAFEAAGSTGLPVWAGFSARRGSDGQVLSFARDRDIRFADIARLLEQYPVDVAGIMHSESEVTGDALSEIRRVYAGPLSAYPDSGHMKMPDWQFEEIIPPQDLLKFAQGWQTDGTQVFGGCCGLGPDHIRTLSSLRS